MSDSLSYILSHKGLIDSEFDKIKPQLNFNDGNKLYVQILKYIDKCNRILFDEAVMYYKKRSIKSINTLSIIDNTYYPTTKPISETSEQDLEEYIKIAYSLLSQELILPFSKPLIDNQLKGLCLHHTEAINNNTKGFLNISLQDIDNEIEDINGHPNVFHITKAIKELNIDTIEYRKEVSELSDFLLANPKQKSIIAKTIVFYKSMMTLYKRPAYLYFINKNPAGDLHFNCTLTIISGAALSPSEIYDFSSCAAQIAAPITSYINMNIQNNNPDSNLRNISPPEEPSE